MISGTSPRVFLSWMASGPFCQSTFPMRSRSAASSMLADAVAMTKIPSSGIDEPVRSIVRYGVPVHPFTPTRDHPSRLMPGGPTSSVNAKGASGPGAS